MRPRPYVDERYKSCQNERRDDVQQVCSGLRSTLPERFTSDPWCEHALRMQKRLVPAIERDFDPQVVVIRFVHDARATPKSSIKAHVHTRRRPGQDRFAEYYGLDKPIDDQFS